MIEKMRGTLESISQIKEQPGKNKRVFYARYMTVSGKPFSVSHKDKGVIERLTQNLETGKEIEFSYTENAGYRNIRVEAGITTLGVSTGGGVPASPTSKFSREEEFALMKECIKDAKEVVLSNDSVEVLPVASAFYITRRRKNE